MKTIKVATDFHYYPAGRTYEDDNMACGERFRDMFLIPALNANEPFIIDLDNTHGYGSNWLHEVFFGLKIWSDKAHLMILKTSNDPVLVSEIEEYINVSKEEYDKYMLDNSNYKIELEPICNTFIMVYHGIIEDQSNAGVLFGANLKGDIDKFEIIKDLVASISKSINEYTLGNIYTTTSEYVQNYFHDSIFIGTFDNIGHYDQILNEWGWCIINFDEYIRYKDRVKHSMSISGFEAFLNPNDYSHYYLHYNGKDSSGEITEEYRLWHNNLFAEFIVKDDYVI